MKTIITEQLISHDINGVPKGLVVVQSTFDAEGKFVANQRHELTAIATSDLAKIQSDLTAEQAKVATEIKAKTVLEAKVTTLESQVATLESQAATLQGQLTSLPTLQSELAEALALVRQYRPYDPNKIRSKAFYDRISGDERFRLGVLAMTDAHAREILALLNEYLLNPTWEVLLNDPKVVGGFQYLQAVGMLTPERVAEIGRPASKEEAFEAPA